MPVCNHVGQVVNDLAQARSFYENALGFVFWFESEPPEELTAKLTSLVPPLGVRACYLVLGEMTLELIHYAQPGVTAEPERRMMNQPGLTHLSIAVDDMPSAVARIVEHGGTVVEGSDVGLGIMVRDPGGQLIELLDAGYRDRLPARPVVSPS